MDADRELSRVHIASCSLSDSSWLRLPDAAHMTRGVHDGQRWLRGTRQHRRRREAGNRTTLGEVDVTCRE